MEIGRLFIKAEPILHRKEAISPSINVYGGRFLKFMETLYHFREKCQLNFPTFYVYYKGGQNV